MGWILEQDWRILGRLNGQWRCVGRIKQPRGPRRLLGRSLEQNWRIMGDRE